MTEDEKIQSTSIAIRIQQNFVNSDSNVKWFLLKELKLILEDKQNHELTSVLYCAVINKLLDSLASQLFEEKWQEELFDEIFLLWFYHDSFLVLVQALTRGVPSYKQTKILNLLEKFIRKGNMQLMFIDQCYASDVTTIKYLACSGLWDELITFIVSLPDRVANKTKGNLKKIFTPTCYISIIRSTLHKVLREIHGKLIDNKDCGLEFLGKVVGRFCNVGHGHILVEGLVSQLIKDCSSDYVWRRISQNLMSKIPPSCLEAFMVHFLTNIPWYGYLDWLLGDTVMNFQKLKYLMTVKFLFIRQFKECTVQQNIIGYFAQSDSRTELFFKIFENLLDIWADEGALKHQNFSQQYYLGASLIICAGHLKTKKKMDINIHTSLQKVLEGTAMRIKSPDSTIRHLGMIVGESLTSVLDPVETKLSFDEELSPELKKLREFLDVPSQPELVTADIELDSLIFSDAHNIKSSTRKSEIHSVATEEFDLNDDEDDLKPYDLSNDVSVDSVKKPLYIRDCLQGLIESEKHEWTDQCVKSAEGLIRSDPESAREIAEEMAKVLVHMDNQSPMPDFAVCRFKAMVALTVHCPTQAAPYLSSLFYERDLNISQRLNILDVLAEASRELSLPKNNAEISKPAPSTASSVMSTEETWRDIVQKRIDAKTRRFAHGPKKPVPEPELNTFGSVAGHFFFPLMEKFDKGNKALDLLGEDSFVLECLLFTLGVIMHSASNTLVAKHMGSALLKFVLVVKDHEEPKVRLSAILAATAVFLSVPPYVLLSEFHNDLLKIRIWLEEVGEKDYNVDCKIQAARALVILINVIQEEMPSLLDSHSNYELMQHLRSVPRSALLSLALIYGNCKDRESDARISNKLFNEVCERLRNLKYLDKSTALLSPLLVKQPQFADAISDYMQQIHHQLVNPSQSLLPVSVPFLDRELSMSSVYKYQTNRYSESFDELKVIAAGGFGTVCKARHKVDKAIYAVKKIFFKYKNHAQFEKIIGEAKQLAALKHPNIVNYNNAWLDTVDDEEEGHEFESHSSSSSSSNRSSLDPENNASSFNFSYENAEYISGSSDAQDSVFTSHHTFEHMTKSKNINITSSHFEVFERRRRHSSGATCSSADFAKLENSSPNEVLLLEEDEPKCEVLPSSSNIKKMTIRATLYIQMEYCDHDLRSWLRQHNSNEDTGIMKQLKPMDIFYQILNGVAFIHSMSVIHRDLTPNNIFISKEKGIIKIGDFGLSCLVHQTEESKCCYSNGSLSSIIGTPPYAAPEQRENHDYDFKVDIYSLGIILVELLCPCQTTMEFSLLIEDVLKQNYPPLFQKLPDHVRLIEQMTQADPARRPTATEILSNPLFKQKSVSKRIEGLKNRILNLMTSLESVEECVYPLKKEQTEVLQKYFDENKRLKNQNELQSLRIKELEQENLLLHSQLQNINFQM